MGNSPLDLARAGPFIKAVDCSFDLSLIAHLLQSGFDGRLGVAVLHGPFLLDAVENCLFGDAVDDVVLENVGDHLLVGWVRGRGIIVIRVLAFIVDGDDRVF